MPRNKKCNKLEVQVGLLFFIPSQKVKPFKAEQSFKYQYVGVTVTDYLSRPIIFNNEREVSRLPIHLQFVQ